MSLRGGEQFFQGERRVFTLQNASNPTCIFGSSVLDQLSFGQLCNHGDVKGQLLIQKWRN